MFIKSRADAKVDEAITAALVTLKSHEPTSNEYVAILEHITRLEKLKSKSGLKPPSLDTVLVVSANLIGIFWLARYERTEVIKSRSALGLVMKPKVNHLT